ncbi:uncharacterized protein LOC135163378 [Diachasmimorpha longicaudata]|uniref:uncharacterized protein LOC135163378 n=1 Tax=Diachasmimorpha longicaudata TaxID=58733 RepID=UPI0030B8C276
MSDEEKQAVSCENGVWTRGIDPPGTSWQKFGGTLLNHMKNAPEHVGQIDGNTGEEDTYASMSDRAIRCALWLKKQGLKAGDCIGICTDNHLNTITPLLAAIFSGIVFHPWWDMLLDDDMVKYFLRLTEPKVLFLKKEVSALVQRSINDLHLEIKIVIFESSENQLSLQDILMEQNSEEVEHFECTKIEDINQPGIMLCTSGSTGYPKCVVHSYNWLEKCINIFPKEKPTEWISLCFSKICWIAAIALFLDAIRNHGTVVLNSVFTAENGCRLIEKYKITFMTMTAAIANQFYKTENIKTRDLSSLRYVIYGGACVSERVDRHLAEIFPNAYVSLSYGSTEIGICLRRSKPARKFCSSGRVERNLQVKVVDIETGKTCGENEKGEIYIKAPQMKIFHYHKDVEGTQKVLDSEGWYHSGDIGYHDADGDFFIIDRLKEVIKYKITFPVMPCAVEEVILKHPDVIEVAVVAKPHVYDVEQPMAFITLRAGSKVTEEEVLQLVRDNLPDHMRLRGGVKILDIMPHVVSGKISRKQLREMAKALAEETY